MTDSWVYKRQNVSLLLVLISVFEYFCLTAFPVDGKYSDWSEFTDCTKTCGGGQKSRRRSCTNPPPQNGGKDCASLGTDTEYADCNVDVSCPGKKRAEMSQISAVHENTKFLLKRYHLHFSFNFLFPLISSLTS